MDNEMIIMSSKLNVVELIKDLTLQIKELNNNFKNLNLNKEEETFFTRKQAQEYYDISERAVIKIFTKLLNDKVIHIGKEQKLAKSHIDDLFKQGIVSK